MSPVVVPQGRVLWWRCDSGRSSRSILVYVKDGGGGELRQRVRSGFGWVDGQDYSRLDWSGDVMSVTSGL